MKKEGVRKDWMRAIGKADRKVVGKVVRKVVGKVVRKALEKERIRIVWKTSEVLWKR